MMDMSAADAKPRNMKKKAARTMADPEDRKEKEKRPMFEKALEIDCGCGRLTYVLIYMGFEEDDVIGNETTNWDWFRRLTLR